MRKSSLTAKLLACTDELADRHVFGPFPSFTCCVEDFPHCAEVFMIAVHFHSHSIVLSEFRRREFGQGLLFFRMGLDGSVVVYWRCGRSWAIAA